MKFFIIIIFFVVVIGFIGGVGYFLLKDKVIPIKSLDQVQETNSVVKLIDFSKINPEFLFSAYIPKELEAEYVSQLKAINIYNPVLRGGNNIEKSQVYISFFKSSKFLTLSTVDITKQDKTMIKGHEAILYEITKKDGVPNFSGQPDWRNFTHKALDIRLTQNSPSYFYSFAYTPGLEERTFNDIINSLLFINRTN
ncbi:MAG: hypothetical protein HY005_02850 [Candidatus Staskawiczbacteria bacterium]|nr:hypothetical protein [Candidatus Staskawiczbacteria bacterium]